MGNFSSRFFFAIFAIACLVLLAHAQQAIEPFAPLQELVKGDPRRWEGSKAELAASFRSERTRLGRGFQSSVLEYLGTDVRKHFWVSSFLVSPQYLGEQEAMPFLSLLIKQQAIVLCEDKPDDESKLALVRLYVTAAIVSQQQGLPALAADYKLRVTRLCDADDRLSGGWPALSKDEQQVYQSIPELTK
mgnify:CR=1 FL=1